ncbi:MAG: 2-C-methyl-D-erythritol 4-phosphate cytidylyltransferase [Bacteroidota bacterium]
MANDLFLFCIMNDLSVIITAGGIGKRMGGNYPKQFRLLNGTPVLMRTIQIFYAFSLESQIIVTLPSEWKEEWKNLCVTHNFKIDHDIVEGGEERFHSVKNALAKCTGSKVMIHDGVRPLVSLETLSRGYQALDTHFGAIPIVDLVDSLRWTLEGENKAVNRSEYKRVQTPQCFVLDKICKAYNQEYSAYFTDDASVFESAGFSINLFPGNEENLKITTENDMLLSEFWLTQQERKS